MASSEPNRARWLVPVLALCLAAVVVFAWPDKPTATPTNPSSEGAANPANDDNEANRPGGAQPETSDNLVRTPAPQLPRTNAPDSSSEPQGLSGVVVDRNSRPLPGVDVYLFESASNDPMLFPKVQQQRHLLAPIASDVSAPDGSFAVGLGVAQNKVYDLFLLSDRHATVRLTGLRLLPATWHDLGDLILEPGTTIRGRVTVAGQPGMPVPQAVVSVSSGGAFADAAMRALPGEQGALVAQVRQNGEYEIQHAPTTGIVRVTALAPGFAQVAKQDVELQSGVPVTVDFELPPGKSITGTVQTKTGLPIKGARIEAIPKQANLPLLVAFSDEQGAFTVHGLRKGLHRLRANAKGFAKAERDGVQPGENVPLTMVPQNRIQVIARAPNGRLLRNYRLALRRFFPKDHQAALDAAALQTGNIGSIHEIRDQRVRLSGGKEFAEIQSVPDGTFVCEVETPGFAKTLSLPVRFPIPASAGPVPGAGTGDRKSVV